MKIPELSATSQSKLKPTTKAPYEWRCSCGRLLFKGAFVVGVIEIKCPRCKRIVYLQEHNTFPSGRESFMTIISMSGVINSISEGVEKVLGYQSSELIGKSLGILLQPEASSALDFWIEKINELGNSPSPNVVATLKVKNSQNQFIQVSFMAKRIMLEGIPMIFIIVEQDETALQRYTEDFVDTTHNSQRSQREIWDFVVQKDGRITNSSGTSSLGYSQNELIGKSILDIISSKSSNNISNLKQNLTQGKSFTVTLELIFADSSLATQDVAFTLDTLLNNSKNQYLVTFKNPKRTQ